MRNSILRNHFGLCVLKHIGASEGFSNIKIITKEDQRVVDKIQGEKISKEFNCIFYESSAKGDSNVYK